MKNFKFMLQSLYFLLFLLFGTTTLSAITATQSSTGYGGVAERAIDGNTAGNWYAYTTTHTSGSTQYDWLLIDLESVQSIDTITLWNRTDSCCDERLGNVRIMVSDTPFTPGTTLTALDASRALSDWEGQVQANTNYVATVPFSLNSISGRYILIQKAGGASNISNFLSIAEVTLQTTPADNCPGTIIPNLEGASSTATDSFNVIVPPSTTYYYQFTPTVAGTIQTNTDTNKYSNSLRIFDGCGGTLLWEDISNSNDKSSPNIAVDANHKIIIAFERRYTTDITLNIDFTFTVNPNTPPTANAGADQLIILGNAVTLNGSGSDSDGTIASYTWQENGTTISTSASFSYTPSSIGSHVLTLTVADNGGATGSDTVTITVNEPEGPPIMNTIPTQTISVNSVGETVNLGGFVTLTNGDPIISYTLGGTLPAGMSFNSTTGIISGTPTVEGNFNLTAYATDNDGDSNTESFTLRVTPANSITNGYRDFALRFQQTLPGKLLTVGNTVLVAPNDQSSNVCNSYTNGTYQSNPSSTNSNASYELCEYHSDTSVSYGTTRAQLPIPVTGTRVVWAGLYWQALVDDAVDVTTMQIKMKHENGTSYTASPYQTIDFDTLDWDDGVGHAGQISYSAFADVTSYFVDNNLMGGYITVGDIPIQEGKIDTLGTYGAWTIVVIYEDTTEALQNFSIYDGWKQVDSGTANVNVDITGFYTPQQPVGLPAIDIVSSVSVFAAEGDKYISNDYLTAQPSKKASDTTLTHTSGQTFNSSIVTSTSFDRLPAPVNNQGIDIQEFDLGSTGYNIIEPEEDSVRFVFSSTQDKYWPSMIAFATELYVPEICYDYTVKIGDYLRIPSDGRNINTRVFTGLPLKIQFAIRSEEADFIYFDTKARVEFTGSDAGRLRYNRNFAEMSPPTINTYFKIADGFNEIETNASIGQIAVGADVIGVTNNNGGRLSPNETTYAILGYDVNGTSELNTHFDFVFDTKIQFDPTATPVDYTFNTSAAVGSSSYIPRCPTNPIYDPVYMQFNGERVGTQNDDLSEKYTLHTQVTGRPYQLDLTSYADDNRSAGAHTPENFAGTIEVEWIDAGGFQNSSSAGYDMVCEEPQAIGSGTLIPFNSATPESRHTINVPADVPGYDDTIALRSAALRLWILAIPLENGDRQIITHQCTDKTNANGCFSTVYNGQIDVNGTGSCVTQCTGTSNTCYNCLRTNYAFPVCSRDNFSIRPASYHIDIRDGGTTGLTANPPSVGQNKSSLNSANLAAGYDYIMEVNATNYNTDTLAQRYNTKTFVSGRYTSLPSPLQSGALAAIEFNDLSTCNDKNSSTIALDFTLGTAQIANFKNGNVGDYKFWIADSNWTAVDQLASGEKPIFDGTAVNDCVLNSADNTQGNVAGCAIYSISGTNLNMNLTFQPYNFRVDTMRIVKHPDDSKNYAFFTDFSNVYYDGILHQYSEMGTSFEGNITARGEDNNTVSNFTKNCAATDVTLSAQIRTNPNDVNASTPLTQYLQHTSYVTLPLSDTQVGKDKNVTLNKVAFTDSQVGTAKVFLHTTFKKDKTIPSNPVIASYQALDAFSLAAQSKSNLGTHTPEGHYDPADRNVTYYYAKVTPQRKLYDNEKASYKDTTLFVDVYCNFISATCNATYNLPNLSSGLDENSENWYSAHFFVSASDGTTDLVAQHLLGEDANPSVQTDTATLSNINTNIPFEDINGSKEDINVSVAGPGRPSTVGVIIKPVPWLLYNSYGLTNGWEEYRVKFIGNNSWSGVGDRGAVVETTSNTDPSPRMNW